MTVGPIETAPHDRPIDVRLAEEQEWVQVVWDAGAGWFEVIGEDTWVLPMELDAWREVTDTTH